MPVVGGVKLPDMQEVANEMLLAAEGALQLGVNDALPTKLEQAASLYVVTLNEVALMQENVWK